MKQYALLRVSVLRQFINLKTILIAAVSFALFLVVAILLVNSKNLVSIYLSPYDAIAKISLVFIIIRGVFNVFSLTDIIFLAVTSFLFALNLVVVYEKLLYVRKGGEIKLVFGSGLVSLASAGCASCGLSIASLIGLGSVVAILPFGGIEFYILSLIILLSLLLYNTSALIKACAYK